MTRPLDEAEVELIPHYFMSRIDAQTRVQPDGLKIAYRNVSSSTDERTMVAAAVASSFPCNDKTPVFVSDSSLASVDRVKLGLAWFTSFAHDFLARVSGGGTGLFAVKNRPAPPPEQLSREIPIHLIDTLLVERPWGTRESTRAMLDSILAFLYELTPHDYAYILATFPLLDRDQPPLPHDYRIRATNKGTDWRKISFITRDLALLTYFDYLAGRLDVKPDPERVRRICPDGVPDPPDDIVTFFAEAGVDIGGATDYAVAATGPYRNLRTRVSKARELGAIAYIPTIDRRRATFVETAAAAGGLAPDEGVLTPEMARRVLSDKAAREAKWARAMELWDATPDPRANAVLNLKPRLELQ